MTERMKTTPQETEWKPKGNKGRGRWAILLFVLVAVAAVLLVSFSPDVRGVLGFETEQVNPAAGSTFAAARGDLRISVIEGGNLKAQKSVKIECEVEGQSTVVFIIQEGTYVKEGELLVELDSGDLEERLTKQEIDYENAKASKTQAEENYKIQIKQNQSDIKAGELAVEFAEDELNKYKEGDWPQQLRTMDNDITIAEEELQRAEDQMKWTQKLEERGFVTSEELNADVLSWKKRKVDLESKREEKRLAEKYDYPMQIRKLVADFEEAERELDRIMARTASELAQKEADKNSKTAQFELQETRFNKLKEQLAKTKIHAPQDGLVVYGSGDSGDWRRRGDSDDQVQEGANVRFRQDLITLPDVSVMMVDCDVHESVVDKVEVGQQALITVASLPDEQYHGKVTKVAVLPDSQSRWLNPDLKVYSTDITMDGGNGKLKPGMSAKVEILVEELLDVLYVPIQSVNRRGGREVCYVAMPDGDVEVRPVAVGQNNEQFVHIQEGLEEGELVLLYPPVIGGEAEEVGEGEDEGETLAGPEEGMPGPPTGTGREGPEGMTGRGEMPAEIKEAMEKMRDMTPEEKREAFEKMRREGKMPFGPPGEGRRGGGGRGDRGDREGGSRNRDGSGRKGGD